MTASEPTTSRVRALKGPLGWLQTALLSAIGLLGVLFVLNVHVSLGMVLFTEQWVALLLTLALTGTFLSIPAGRRASRARLPWYDALLCVLSLPAGLWITVYYPTIVLRLGQATTERLLVGSLAIVLILEAVRRLIGWPLVIIAVVFIWYGRYSTLLPGALSGATLSWPQLVNYLYLDPNSILYLVGIAATMGLAFIFFGQVLLVFGGAEALTNIALLLFGRVRGGPGKAAVVGSSMVGTVTGGPVTNVFLTGSITIPMMIRSGYPRPLAGAVEAVASSGGQIMPPVMGIAAFIMAETLGIPYAQVALAALLPALLFYLAVFIQVDLEAGKHGLRGLQSDELPAIRQTLLGAGPITLVLGILVYNIFVAGIDPATAGVYTALLAIPILALQQGEWRAFFRRLLQVVRGTGQQVLDVVAALSAAGLVVGVISVSGLGFTFGFLLTQLGGHSLFLLLIAAAIGSIILGMGMPSVAAYALVAVMMAPAITAFGVAPLAAHLFIFYFAIASNFTPPVALAAYAAAAISGTGPMATGYAAMRLGVLSYIIPFLFVLSPTLLLQGDVIMVILSIVTAVLGTFALGTALAGYLFAPVHWLRRVLVLIAGVLLLIPLHGFDLTALVNVAGLALTLAVLGPDFRRGAAARRGTAVA